MEATGIIRRVDDLGRIVIPREIRRIIFGKNDSTGEPMEIFVSGNDIVLRKYESAEETKAKEIRNKALDEFVEQIDKHIFEEKTEEQYSNSVSFMREIRKISEQLKEGV